MALHSHKQGGTSDNLLEKQRNGYSGSEFLDSRWSGVGAKMGDHELEEGEACDEADVICDPDNDFAYLDEKIFMVLGDVQKYFDGRVSTEKLGLKFGGYGSFLSPHERTSSILQQDKPVYALANDAYCRTKKSSNEGLVERIKRTATGTSVRASSLKAGSSSALLMHENGAQDSKLVNEKTTNVDSSFPVGRIDENTGPPKNFKIKIKMGLDTNEKKKNATIYSDFGLSNSSSEADDEFVDEDGRTDSDLDSSSDKTPLTMIRIMTSHHIPDGMLLSPLPDLVTEPFLHKERFWSTCQEDSNEKLRSPGFKKVRQPKDDANTSAKVDIPREKRREHADERKGDSSDRPFKRVEVEKERGGSKDSSRRTSKAPSKAYGKAPTKVSEGERQARDAVSESGTGGRSNDSNKDYKGCSVDRAPPDYSLYEADHIPKDFCSPFQPPKEVDPGRELQSRGYRVEKGASSHDSINEHMDVSHQGRNAGKEVFNTSEMNVHGKRPLDVSSEPSDGKKRSSVKGFLVPSEGKTNSTQDGRLSTSKGGGIGKFLIPAADVPAKEVVESKKRSLELGQEADGLRGLSRERGKDSLKEVQRSVGKDKYLKASSATDLMVDETLKDGPQHSIKPVAHKDYKGFQQGDLAKVHQTESTDNKRKERTKERITSDFGSKEPSKVSEERQRELATKDVPTKVSHPAYVSEAVREGKQSQQPQQPQLGAPVAGNGAPPYELIVDNWVGCDKCQKWRLLPPGVDTANLPKKWLCKMIYWLEEGMNNCSVPEDVTVERTRALYYIVPEHPVPVVSIVQENPPVVEQVQPPVSVVTSLPPPSAIVSQETKAPDKIRGTANKRRKVPPTASSENILPSKIKSFAEAPQVTQDAGQAKLGGGATTTTQEKVLAAVGGPDLGPAKTGEEKQKLKEREKARRHRPSDGGSGSSPSVKKLSQTPANLALRDATKLKHKADNLQGQERAGTALYLQAALKFLQAASMLETEGSEHGDHKLPVKLYAGTAQLCNYCASNYERSKDLAAAALAYKCAGLARMRVVQAKSSLINKDRADVQSAHQVAPGESPSLSTPLDINSVMDRMPPQGAATPTSGSHMGGSLIIAAKCRTSFNRILQFVAETNTAVDALSKALHVFTAAESASTCTEEGMAALKNVLDFSFHDVDSFVRLVRIALEAMGL
ncbi:hypothetical protein GOP47_0008033 [Adiantum capillus-veneris]|uniref:CW-type domain-containing protein n=1 Tax=Adiantum capillus-veneris TaxID=13818 RepID=A0A9D4ZHN9_ADICA|nr:hypothetical protein GOP47_0008033 [Adiantum capillus-veneris]